MIKNTLTSSYLSPKISRYSKHLTDPFRSELSQRAGFFLAPLSQLLASAGGGGEMMEWHVEEATSTDVKHRFLTVPPAPDMRQDWVSVYQMSAERQSHDQGRCKAKQLQGNHCSRREEKEEWERRNDYCLTRVFLILMSWTSQCKK